jgi:hypothetical protein
MTLEAMQRKLWSRVMNMAMCRVVAATCGGTVPAVKEGEGELKAWLKHCFVRGTKRWNTDTITYDCNKNVARTTEVRFIPLAVALKSPQPAHVACAALQNSGLFEKPNMHIVVTKSY